MKAGASTDILNGAALLAQIEAFCAEHGMSEATFGKRARYSSRGVMRLRRNGRVSERAAAKFVALIEAGPGNYRSRLKPSKPAPVAIAAEDDYDEPGDRKYLTKRDATATQGCATLLERLRAFHPDRVPA